MPPLPNNIEQKLQNIQRRNRYLLFKMFIVHLRCQIIRLSILTTCIQILFRLQTKRKSIWGGRALGSRNLKRRKVSTWISDYLGPTPVYPSNLFRRRFAVPRTLFERLRNDLLAFNPTFWKQRRRGVGALGHTPEQRVLCALRILSTGCSHDNLDDGSVMS